MTTNGEPRVWLTQFPLGEPQLFVRDHGGIRFPGEVIRDERWLPRWGEPLTGDAYFRIVLLEQPVATAHDIHDSRIALCVPGTGEYHQRDRLVDELATIRETQALYLAQRDPEADLIRRTLQRRREGLEDELIAQEVSRYASGTIVVAPQQATPPTDLFGRTDPVTWISRIAWWLLEQAYPGLPVNADLLPRPVTHQDAAGLYQAVFNQPGQSAGILAEMGPGLGLSSAHSPEEFSTLSCPVLEIVDNYLASRTGPTSWPELHNHLAHRVGLTRPLATLYLLVFLLRHRTELEIGLSPEHQLMLAGGRPLPGARLTADLIPALTWDDRLADWPTTIGSLTQPQWNDTLPYLVALCPDLVPSDDEANIAGQELRLFDHLGRLDHNVALGKEFLALLERRGGATLAASPRLSLALGRLSSIYGNDFRSVYHSARHIYGDYRTLEQDVDLQGQLSRLARSSRQIQATWQYLDQAAVPEEMADLYIERRGLEAALAPESLLRFSRTWDMLSRQIANFKASYATAYRAHHQQINHSLPAYEHNLSSGRLKLRALELLNTLPELGPPAGLELPGGVVALEQRPPPCSTLPEELDLQETPWCASCRLTLEQGLPEDALARLSTAIDAALGEKNRQLSNLLVERILHGQTDQRLDDFLKIVQASDLSALSNTINEELVAFVRRMLS